LLHALQIKQLNEVKRFKDDTEYITQLRQKIIKVIAIIYV